MGAVRGINDPNAWSYVDPLIVLTREKIDAALARGSYAIVPVERRDTVKGGDGHYVLSILIERLP